MFIQSVMLHQKRMKFVISVSFAIGGLPLVWKILFTDEKELFFPVIFPYTDPDTPKGFYLNLAHQLLVGFLGAFIVLGSEIADYDSG